MALTNIFSLPLIFRQSSPDVKVKITSCKTHLSIKMAGFVSADILNYGITKVKRNIFKLQKYLVKLNLSTSNITNYITTILLLL